MITTVALVWFAVTALDVAWYRKAPVAAAPVAVSVISRECAECGGDAGTHNVCEFCAARNTYEGNL
jgi:hypothetical protein